MSLNPSFETKVLSAFVAALLVVAALTGVSWKAARDIHQAAHTHEVLDHLADARAGSLLIELSAQNCRITGDHKYLARRASSATRSHSMIECIVQILPLTPLPRGPALSSLAGSLGREIFPVAEGLSQ